MLVPAPRRLSLRSLSERFDTTVQPCHRALADAQATAEILLVLLGRAQERGARTVDDLLALGAPARRRLAARGHLAEAAPRAPGTYVMRTRSGVPLYVGTATDLRVRVRSYFRAGRTAQDRPVDEVLPAVERIDYARSGSAFEARLDELALIAGLRPGANRQGARPGAGGLPAARRRRRRAGSTSARRARTRCSSARCSAGATAPGRPTPCAWPTACAAAGRRRRSRARASRAGWAAAWRRAAARTSAPRTPRRCAAVAALLREGGAAPVARLRERRQALSDARRFEEAARVRDAEAALRRVAGGLRALRQARRRHGAVLAPHLDPRLVQGFAIAHGLVVARRPLPRAGDAALEASALADAIVRAAALAPEPGPLAVPAERAEELRLVHATFGRPRRRSPSCRSRRTRRARPSSRRSPRRGCGCRSERVRRRACGS